MAVPRPAPRCGRTGPGRGACPGGRRSRRGPSHPAGAHRCPAGASHVGHHDAAPAQANGLDPGLHARRGNRDPARQSGTGAAVRGAAAPSAREDSPSVGCSAARARRPAEPPPSSPPIRGANASTAAAAAAAGTSVARTNPVLGRRLSAPCPLSSAVARPAARGRGGSRSPRAVAGGLPAGRRPRGVDLPARGAGGLLRSDRSSAARAAGVGAGANHDEGFAGGSGVVTAGGVAVRWRRGSAARRAFAAATISSRALGSRRALSPGRRRPEAGRSDKATAAARRGARVAEAAQRAGDEGRGQGRQPGPVLVRQPAQAGRGRQARRGDRVL